jgi:hypothetical protein
MNPFQHHQQSFCEIDRIDTVAVVAEMEPSLTQGAY